MTTFPPDAGIPLLTEVIPGPAPAEPRPAPPAPALPPSGRLGGAAAEARPASVDENWTRIAREAEERVLEAVLGRIDGILEQRVRDSLADALQTSVDRLAGDIRKGLASSLRDVIGQAVAQEVTRAKSAINETGE